MREKADLLHRLEPSQQLVRRLDTYTRKRGEIVTSRNHLLVSIEYVSRADNGAAHGHPPEFCVGPSMHRRRGDMRQAVPVDVDAIAIVV